MRSEVKSPINNIPNKLLGNILLLGFIFSVVGIEIFFGQKDFFSAFPIYSLAFGMMVCIYRSNYSLRTIVVVGLIIRIVFLFSMPGFSDDVYRFYWDGRLILEGINPYGVLPTDVVNYKLKYLDGDLFHLLNSPQYYTIYPPFNQLYFAIGALAGNIHSSIVVMKLLIIATELLGLWYLTKLLKRSGISTKNIILYYLNPLVILEGAGNLHFEVVMLSFLIVSVYYIFSDKIFQAAVFLACSIGVKLLPLMILPYFFFRMPSKKRNRFFIILTGLLLIIFTPLLFGLASTSFLDSIDLYFRKFEFNASLYYLFRYVGTIVSGYNLIHFIGPMLAIVTLITNVYLASRSKVYNESTFWNYSLIIWTIYLLLATTVHPWYTISLVLLSVCASRIYPIFWSFLAFVSYVNYSYDPYFENMWFISFEYILLFIVMTIENKISPFLPSKTIELR